MSTEYCRDQDKVSATEFANHGKESPQIHVGDKRLSSWTYSDHCLVAGSVEISVRPQTIPLQYIVRL